MHIFAYQNKLFVMAGSKGSKYYNFFLKYKLWLANEQDNKIIDETAFVILKEIQAGGSLSFAADKIGISYRKAWGDLKQAEQMMGFKLIEKQRGGAEGGKSWLTPEGEKLVDSYSDLIAKLDDLMSSSVKEFFNSLNS